MLLYSDTDDRYDNTVFGLDVNSRIARDESKRDYEAFVANYVRDLKTEGIDCS
jgi:hypothetical protein